MCIRDRVHSYEIVVKEQNNDAVKYTIKTSAHVDSVDAIDWTDWTDTAGKNITIDINKYLDLPGTKTYEFHVTPVAYNSALYGVQKAQTSVEVTRNPVAKPTDFTLQNGTITDDGSNANTLPSVTARWKPGVASGNTAAAASHVVEISYVVDGDTKTEKVSGPASAGSDGYMSVDITAQTTAARDYSVKVVALPDSSNISQFRSETLPIRAFRYKAPVAADPAFSTDADGKQYFVNFTSCLLYTSRCV